MRQASSPNFAPPVEEGAIYTFQDERGEQVSLEFLGLIIYNNHRYGFFYPALEQADASDSGEVVILEVTELDSEGQPEAFELLVDEAIAAHVYEQFKAATAGMYDFA